jgi:hypothetical protein
MGGGGAMITSLLPAWIEARICLRLRQHGLNPVYLVQCLFLLFPLFLCVAYSCAVVDEKRSHHWCDTPTSEISVKIPRHLVQLLDIRILIPNAVKKIHGTIEKAAKVLVS